MCNFEKETVSIWSHVGLSLLGHPHEPRQPQPQGPQQVIDRYNKYQLFIHFACAILNKKLFQYGPMLI